MGAIHRKLSQHPNRLRSDWRALFSQLHPRRSLHRSGQQGRLWGLRDHRVRPQRRRRSIHGQRAPRMWCWYCRLRDDLSDHEQWCLRDRPDLLHLPRRRRQALQIQRRQRHHLLLNPQQRLRNRHLLILRWPLHRVRAMPQQTLARCSSITARPQRTCTSRKAAT